MKSLDPNLCIIDDCCLCIPELADSLPENVDLCLYSTGYAKFIELSYGGYASFRGWLLNVNLFNEFRFSEAQARKICDVINSVI